MQLDERIQIAASLIALQPSPGHIACGHLSFLLGSVMGGRFHSSLGCLYAAFSAGQPSTRLHVV